MVPALETDRLVLRAHRRKDLESVHTMWTHPIVYRHITQDPSTREQSWARLLRYAGLWPLLGYGFWVIETKKGGDFVGELGFADFERDITPPFGGIPEMGWVLTPQFHGKGYAHEALAKVIEWGVHHLDVDRTRCIISTENIASIRLAEKSGFTRLLETTYSGKPVLLMEKMFGSSLA